MHKKVTKKKMTHWVWNMDAFYSTHFYLWHSLRCAPLVSWRDIRGIKCILSSHPTNSCSSAQSLFPWSTRALWLQGVILVSGAFRWVSSDEFPAFQKMVKKQKRCVKRVLFSRIFSAKSWTSRHQRGSISRQIDDDFEWKNNHSFHKFR